MALGFVKIGKLAMATIGTIWTISNVEVLYNQIKLILSPSSYTFFFFFFHIILLSILFQYSPIASNFKHLLHHNLLQANNGNSQLNSTPQFLETRLSRSFSEIWHLVMGLESEKGHKEDGNITLEPILLEEDQSPYPNEEYKDEKDLIMEEDVEEDGKETMEETWRSIMEGKKKAERELKKSNTWGVTPTIEQMKGRIVELQSSKSLRFVEENGRQDCFKAENWGWRKMEVVLSRDELNRRAEEFINKIKDNIRLERLESYNLFLQLINRRAN